MWIIAGCVLTECWWIWSEDWLNIVYSSEVTCLIETRWTAVSVSVSCRAQLRPSQQQQLHRKQHNKPGGSFPFWVLWFFSVLWCSPGSVLVLVLFQSDLPGSFTGPKCCRALEQVPWLCIRFRIQVQVPVTTCRTGLFYRSTADLHQQQDSDQDSDQDKRFCCCFFIWFQTSDPKSTDQESGNSSEGSLLQTEGSWGSYT